jgi:peptidoglycan/xylan/chitin deacetylase (PgdA/CDA1 family)
MAGAQARTIFMFDAARRSARTTASTIPKQVGAVQMRIAFTMDDLPLWPMSYPPLGYTAEGIVRSIREALNRHAIPGVYAFSNSWPLADHPEFAAILDDWVADGHHVANHTHGHIELPDVPADTFVADIARAETILSPWLDRAPRRLFRHPLCHWGETPEKLAQVNTFLAGAGLTPVDVTSWAYEWTWNQAYRNALDAGDADAKAFVRQSFLDFSVAQLRHDQDCARAVFGAEVTGIALGHNVPFFADIADAYFARLIDEGVTFVPLDEALDQPCQAAVGSVVSDKFLVLQQKLADASGKPLAKIAPGWTATYARIVDMARGQTG